MAPPSLSGSASWRAHDMTTGAAPAPPQATDPACRRRFDRHASHKPTPFLSSSAPPAFGDSVALLDPIRCAHGPIGGDQPRRGTCRALSRFGVPRRVRVLCSFYSDRLGSVLASRLAFMASAWCPSSQLQVLPEPTGGSDCSANP